MMIEPLPNTANILIRASSLEFRLRVSDGPFMAKERQNELGAPCFIRVISSTNAGVKAYMVIKYLSTAMHAAHKHESDHRWTRKELAFK